jgi:predicted transcriptional regulator
LTARRSKLQRYLHTIKALTNNGPIKLSKLSLKTKINCSPLKAILLDLERKQPVEQKQINGNLVYVATPKARTALLSFKDLPEFLSNVLAVCP